MIRVNTLDDILLQFFGSHLSLVAICMSVSILVYLRLYYKLLPYVNNALIAL